MKWLWIALLLAVGCARPTDPRIQLTYQTIETLPEQQALHRKIVDEFERLHPAVHINVVYDTSKFQKLNVQLAGNAGPDMFYCVVDRLPSLALRGQLLDLTADFAPLSELFYAEVFEACRVDGRIAMAPFHFSTDVLFYNRDWFSAADESPPDDSWGWQRFADVAARLVSSRKQGGHATTRMATALPRPLLLIQSFGGVLFADDHCAVNSPETMSALQFYRDLVARGIAPTAVSMGELEAFDGVNLFHDARIPLLIGRAYMLTEFDRITDFHWAVAPVPKGKVRWSRLSVGGNCVWRGTKHPQEAREFVRFYSTEGAKLAAKTRNAIPALRAAAESATFPPAMVAALSYSHLDNPWGYAFWDEFNQKAFLETTDAVALGRMTPAAAAESIEKLGERLLPAR